ncbi:hypothetical protein BFX40_20480 [Mesorhizobium sp. SEMIA 3007]|uniref:hypothetical protein n=1 Tax=Mesorhizobium sp. SEMIA 3007 TaxID=1862350 RepID=UPI00083DEEAC|nr:hypothetical protein [Mesorhizobium sp. SEMIA 3007]ODA95006.1 hypothetical protein BFX40_20480 [Mesorhizobium sp. SEMIA 3007]
MKNDPDGRAALRLIRETVEEHCPPGVLPSEEAVNALYGPGLMDEAEAIAAAVIATVNRLQLQTAPSIKA